jgi:hypothetical protein
MAKKIDFDFKQFMLQKGERAGLGVALGLMTLLIIMGVWTGLGKKSPLPLLIKNADDLDQRVRSTTPTKKPLNEAPEPARNPWLTPDPEDYIATEWSMRQNMENTKRRNPIIRPLAAYQVDVVRLPVRMLNVQDGKVDVLGTADAQNQNFAEQPRPTRMIIVSAVFPYAKQLEDYKAALNRAEKSKKKKGKKKGKAEKKKPVKIPEPVFKGFYIYRRTILPNGQVLKWKDKDGKEHDWKMIVLDLKEKRKFVANPFRTLLSTSPAVDSRDKKLGNLALPGLVMPRPALMGGFYYPTVELPSSKDPKENFLKDPEVISKGPTGQEGSVNQADVSKLPDEWKERLRGNIDVFDPQARILDKNGRRVNKENQATDEDKAEKKDDRLVRFIDVDIKPGYTYDYSIVIRVANPNYRKPKLVASKRFAKIKELLSPYNYIAPVTVPYDTLVYAVDELSIHPDYKGKSMLLGQEKKVHKLNTELANNNRVAVQIHRWVPAIQSQKETSSFSLGEWLIAERLLVKRGEFIGRKAEVQVPKWLTEKQTYEILYPPKKLKRFRSKTRQIVIVPRPWKGVLVDFTARTDAALPAALLVDFNGGRQTTKIGGSTFADESAAELLILNPDGRLEVRNALEDSDRAFPTGKAREERHQAWKERMDKLNGAEVKQGKNDKGSGLDKGKPKKGKKGNKGGLDNSK